MERVTRRDTKQATRVPTTKANPRSTKAWEKFADFETLGDPQLEQMKDEAVRFTHDMMHDAAPRWLSLLGTSGSGKTMLAKRIAKLFRYHRSGQIDWARTEKTRNELQPHGRIIRWRGGFINWGDAINHRMLQGDYSFIADMRDYDFFAIDDIVQGHEKHRALWASKLLDIFEARLKKWTVITANCTLKEIAANMDTRLASRMLRDGGIVVAVNVLDFSLRPK